MLELTALSVIVILYIIPLNISVYRLSTETALLLSQSDDIVPLASGVFYVLYAIILFAIVYALIKYLILEGLGEGSDARDRIVKLLNRHKQGQKGLNVAGNIGISLVLLVHFVFMVFDIKIIVMGMLCIVFVFRDVKHRDISGFVKGFKKVRR